MIWEWEDFKLKSGDYTIHEGFKIVWKFGDYKIQAGFSTLELCKEWAETHNEEMFVHYRICPRCNGAGGTYDDLGQPEGSCELCYEETV